MISKPISILIFYTLTSHVVAFAPRSLPIATSMSSRTSNFNLRSSKSERDVETKESPANPILTFFDTFNIGKQASIPVETEEERLQRLKREALAQMEEKEVERAIQVRNDALPYLFILALQFLPLIGTDRIESITYFWGVAVATVYVGGRQVTLQESEKVSSESALYAPIGASVSIGLLYVLINAGFNPALIYAFGVSAFGALAISDIGVPLLRNILPEAFSKAKVKVPEKVSNMFGLSGEDLPLDGLTTLILGLGCTVAYWSPFAMEQKFLVSNLIAWALAMTSLGAISLGSFQTAAILLAGLFCYDIFFVFGTDVMMTVATKIEAPVKFLYTAPPPAEGAEPRDYPFSVLGLGDIVIPGLFIRFMSKIDSVLKPEKFSYFGGATFAYAAGLSVCFAVNEITHAGQPALLYLDPACITSALAVGAANGQLDDLWNFEEEEIEE